MFLAIARHRCRARSFRPVIGRSYGGARAGSRKTTGGCVAGQNPVRGCRTAPPSVQSTRMDGMANPALGCPARRHPGLVPAGPARLATASSPIADMCPGRDRRAIFLPAFSGPGGEESAGSNGRPGIALTSSTADRPIKRSWPDRSGSSGCNARTPAAQPGGYQARVCSVRMSIPGRSGPGKGSSGPTS